MGEDEGIGLGREMGEGGRKRNKRRKLFATHRRGRKKKEERRVQNRGKNP